ncbi:MAG TPA: electron transfer flavoprotein subunit beta/FixA family protein [Spirochaetota bacterium]|nr:electron transfer flavoprotein subunit beta/FixA family protein [Spirochaetota bacterium]HPC40473.1 electron transfer flavoprotein subunit beta/FixA family protein [Spirochaetota bacterium]HPL15788.1 electron transfer flavoprotein subunit beta/FixA family protein [Spirochaetota bacterium]HQF06540.1 electron transfer flavoprotein subunit beta/FixA family protein [Spirochaetota bacterium]HQH96057.1 electron transfer flavoprotein subunit beta/FixA family protein [Spirochaetota bacterium]
MLSILVCIKQVPDTQKALFDSKTGVIDRNSADNIMNPDDLHAIEMALAIKDGYGATITALTMGPPQAADVLGEAYAMGVDRGVLISDPRFAGSDSLVTSKTLYRAIAKLGAFDIVMTGCEAIDGNTGHVGYQLSEFLHMPLLTQIHKFRVSSGQAVIERLYGHEYQKIRVGLPVLITVGKTANRVRTPRLADIKTSADREITVLTMDDIGGDAREYGAAGSPTVVIETELFSHRRERVVFTGTVDEKVDHLIHRLKKQNILRY